ncbi:hypothetical protein H5410_055606, partial [Solanum commersonii]
MKPTKGRITDLLEREVFERVNPSPSPTHLARESEWAKADNVLHKASGCLKGTHLIRGNPLPWDLTPTFGWVTLQLYDRRHLH